MERGKLLAVCSDCGSEIRESWEGTETHPNQRRHLIYHAHCRLILCRRPQCIECHRKHDGDCLRCVRKSPRQWGRNA